MQLLIAFFLSWLVFAPIPDVHFYNENDLGNRIALGFSGGESFIPDREQLALAHKIGINLLEIAHPSQLANQRVDGFYLLLDSNLKFPTIHVLQSGGDTLIREIEQHFREVNSVYADQIAAVNLFRYPADQKENFSRTASPLADSLRQRIGKPVYYHSAFAHAAQTPAGFSFISNRIFADHPVPETENQVIAFEPSENGYESLKKLEQILNQTLAFDDSIVIIPAHWFFTRLDKQPDLGVIFSGYLEGETVQFPLPADEELFLPEPNWILILLLAIWVSFIIHYKYQPIYPSIVLRYFSNHSFFVADVMENRFRSISAGFILIIQHSVITGLFILSIAEFSLSKTGFEVLSWYYPFIIFSGLEPLGLFILALITGLLSHFISLVWIYLSNKAIQQPVQVINLYSWPLVLNLFVVSLIVYQVLRDVSAIWVVISSLIFILVWFMSFNAAVIDGARYLEKYRVLNMLINISIHFLLIAALIIFVLVNPAIFEPIQLAISLP